MLANTPGKRVYLVRLALGDGLRNPLTMERFAALLTERTGKRYDSGMLSRIENGDRRVTIEDCEAIAPLDPMKRGPGWLAFGEQEERLVSTETSQALIQGAVPLTASQKARAAEKTSAKAKRTADQAREKSAPRVRQRKNGGHG